jgi:hypothetical protein
MAAATKKKRKEEAYPWKTGSSSGHITNLKQSILETFDIYGVRTLGSAPALNCQVYETKFTNFNQMHCRVVLVSFTYLIHSVFIMQDEKGPGDVFTTIHFL